MESETEIVRKRLMCIDLKTVHVHPCIGKIFHARLIKVTDGDTLSVIVLLSNDIPLKVAVRVTGIDAPESKLGPKTSPLEKKAGQFVKSYVQNLFRDTQFVDVEFECADKYGGRCVGDVYIDSKKKIKLSSHLLQKGYVKKYDGGTKHPWTESELNKILEKGKEKKK